MFTGIIKHLGEVSNLKSEGTNKHITVLSDIARHVNIDESVAHDGVCLTVVSKTEASYTVTAIDETLQKTNLQTWNIGKKVNLEQAMVASARLDGHMVQGHVDTVATCQGIKNEEGSWVFTFSYPIDKDKGHMLVDKGSVCLNGISLTVVNPIENTFQVAIIPYTFEHTNLQFLKQGDTVNIEFDIIGKYVANYMQAYLAQ